MKTIKSIEEKAKRYDEALERAKNTIEVNQTIPDIVECVESLFPELAENKDERIRKWLIDTIKQVPNDSIEWETIDKSSVLAWLEKQGNQDNNEDSNILQRFSFYSYKDEPNILYLAGLYVNEEYRNKGIGTKILEVADEVAKSLGCNAIRLKTKKDSDAEKLYRTHGYNSLATENKDEIWLEKQGERNLIVPKFRIGDIITPKGKKEYYTIIDIVDGWYEFKEKHVNGGIPIYYQDDWELVEQKPADKVEPKFKVGDWVIGRATSNEPRQISEITDQYYKSTYGGQYGFSYEDEMHLWTIQEAKDGDVLAYNDGSLTIFSYRLSGLDAGLYMAHVLLTDKIKSRQTCAIANVHPATKEQRDFLFAKMKDAGYIFDFEKKELKKIIDEKQIKKNLQDNSFRRMFEQNPTEFNVSDEIVEASAFRDKLLELFQKFRWKDFPTNGDIIDYVDSHIQELIDSIQKPAEWEPQTGDTFRKKGTTSPTYHLCDKREDGITFGFVENREVGISGGEITIFTLKQDYELVERPKSIEDVVEEEFNKVVCPNDVWSEEDDNCLSTIIAEFSKCSGKTVSKDELMRCNDFLNSIKDRVQPQQEWSEEDEKYSSYICAALECYYRLREERNNTNGQEDLNKARNWIYNKLKFLSPQNKWKLSAWNEEEQQIIEDAASFILSCVNTAETKKEEERLEELADKLQDLKPHNRWKPSDEQMKALKHASNDCSIAFADMKILATLYEQLKALHRYEQDT